MMRTGLFILVLMFAAAASAIAMKPVRIAPDAADRVDYESLIPRGFGTWSMLPADVTSVINPQQQEVLDRIYSQIISRAYRDSQTGSVVMLAIAYGEEQSKQSQVHFPEVCYPAQGFQIAKSAKDELTIQEDVIPVTRLVATLDARHEPITYWIRLGKRVVRGNLEQKIATVQEGLAGRVSDGLLFRVSSIENDTAKAYRLHDRFAADLLQAIAPDSRRLLIGGEVRPQ